MLMPRPCNRFFALNTIHTLLFRGIILFPAHAFLWDFSSSRRAWELVPLWSISLVLFLSKPKFNPSVILVNSQLLCLPSVGIFKPIMFSRWICRFQFKWHAFELARCSQPHWPRKTQHLNIFLNIKNWCCSKNKNNNELQKQKDPYDAWEVKSDDVIISEELGQGAFGKVYKGTMKMPLSKKKSLKSTTAVAVKVLQGKLQRVMEWMLSQPD